MQHVVCLSFFLLALVILFEDFRSRSLHIVLLVLVGVLGSLKFFGQSGITILDLACNFGFLIILLVLSFSLLYLKRGNIKGLIGAGDVLFLAFLTFYFNFPVFPILINISLILSLILHFVFQQCHTGYRSFGKIPLAGFQAPIFACALVIDTYVYPLHSYFH